MRIWILAIATVAVLALAGGYWYGSWESDEVLVRQSADTASEGIKVHGDWEVTVSDPATGEEMVYAFENKLSHPSGNALLAVLMRGEGIVKFDGEGHPSVDCTNKWKIHFESDNNNAGTRYAFADTSLILSHNVK